MADWTLASVTPMTPPAAVASAAVGWKGPPGSSGSAALGAASPGPTTLVSMLG